MGSPSCAAPNPMAEAPWDRAPRHPSPRLVSAGAQVCPSSPAGWGCASVHPQEQRDALAHPGAAATRDWAPLLLQLGSVQGGSSTGCLPGRIPSVPGITQLLPSIPECPGQLCRGRAWQLSAEQTQTRGCCCLGGGPAGSESSRAALTCHCWSQYTL